MATYLWQGRPYTQLVPSTIRVDKYCWNTPGNWKVKQVINDVPQWVQTNDVPGGGDIAVVGGEVPTDVNNYLELNDSSGELAGWSPAHCPLLFGGYSGGVGQGTWAMSGPTYTYGNTWTNSLSKLIVNSKGCMNAGWFGTGITGTGLRSSREFVTFNDSFVSPVGATFYTDPANTSGFRNPTEPLRLKVRDSIEIDSNVWILNGTFTDYGNSISTANEYEFRSVKAYTAYTGITNDSVETSLKFHGPFGQKLTIHDGAFRDMDINYSNVHGISANGATAIQNSMPGNVDLGTYWRVSSINLNNVIADKIKASKAGFVNVNGGTVSEIRLKQHPYYVSNTIYLDPYAFVPLPGSTTGYVSQADANIVCGFNKHQTQSFLYGITSGAPGGDLYLEDTPFSIQQIDVPSVAEIVNSYPGYIYNEYVRLHNGYSLVTQRVFLGNTATTIKIPNIWITCAKENTTLYGGIEFMLMPWSIIFKGSAIVDRIDNVGGVVYSDENLQNTNSIRIGECHLSKFGSINFGRNNSAFDNWLIGGLTANYVVGGIISDDETGTVRGSANMKLINTQVKAVYNARNEVGLPQKVSTFKPTGSTP
jgi:hypothetical protein